MQGQSPLQLFEDRMEPDPTPGVLAKGGQRAGQGGPGSGAAATQPFPEEVELFPESRFREIAEPGIQPVHRLGRNPVAVVDSSTPTMASDPRVRPGIESLGQGLEGADESVALALRRRVHT